jgi:predicted O-linked N-acetylglucosamine transferase (SPINDLY family)
MSPDSPEDSAPTEGRALTEDRHAAMLRAVALQNRGQLDEAARVYRRILAHSPQDFDAMHLLGVVALQQGRHEDARRLILEALALDPLDAAAMGNLGTSYLRDGDVGAALPWFERALELEPDSPDALTNAATAMHQTGRYREAIPLLTRAYASRPESHLVCKLLGACLLKTGRERDAVEFFDTAVRVEPRDAEGWANLSVALHATGDTARARECADAAVKLEPGSAGALAALAAAQFEQGRLTESVASYRRAMALGAPSVQMLADCATVLLASGLQQEAAQLLGRASLLDERNLVFRWTRVMAQLPAIAASESDVAAARDNFSAGLEEIENWYRSTVGIERPFEAVGVQQPFYLAYQPFNNLALMTRYGDLCALWMATFPAPAAVANGLAAQAMPRPVPGRKLRIGFVSAHVSAHSVWNAITKGWVHHLDRSRFEVYLFHVSPTLDAETERAKAIVDGYVDEPRDECAWIEAIVGGRLDVLIYPEVGMTPLTLRLAALRLAPVQATTWGHPETSGLPTMDLYFSAEALEPLNGAANYRERLIRLPNLGVYVEPLAPPNVKLKRRSIGIPSGEPLLLCPGSPFKYSPLHDRVWAGIAARLPRKFLRFQSGGRLVFFRSRSDAMDGQLQTRLRAVFERAGVDFDAHVSWIPYLNRPKFFGLMREARLMLDTLGFSGFNTAIQAVECGLPILTFEGEFMRGRLASAVMRELDLPELVATSLDEFIDKAVALTGDPRTLRRLSALMKLRRTALFENLAPVRALEQRLAETVFGQPDP